MMCCLMCCVTSSVHGRVLDDDVFVHDYGNFCAVEL